MTNNINEIWKPVNIPHFYDKYEVSTTGQIRIKNKPFPPMKDILSDDGYKYINLRYKGQQKSCRINRLVAITFLPNPYGKPAVNHKNSNRTDNNLFNLQWMTLSENSLHAVKYRDNSSIYRPVLKYDLEMKFLEEYPSINAAARSLATNPDTGNSFICMVCNGKKNSYLGFIWRYKYELILPEIDLTNFVEIKPYPRYMISKEGKEVYSTLTNRLLTIRKYNGYSRVTISFENKSKYIYVHQLMAETFLEKPDGEDIVIDHINSIRTDNRLENIRYCTHIENIQACFDTETGTDFRRLKKCAQYDKNMKLIAIYIGTKKASEATGVSMKSISRYCLGTRTTQNGNIWKYI